MDDDDRMITVCAACLRASCWYGEFYCEDFRSADVTARPLKRLKEMDLESSHYWTREYVFKVTGN